MQLADLSGIAYHKIIGFYAEGQTPDIADVRHALFTELQEYEEQYTELFGRMVICADSKPYWRTEVQPSYKMNRIKARSKSDINSEAFYADLAILKQDIIEQTNYMLIDTKGAEADDVIAVLTEYAASIGEKIVILSSDKDMLQLQVLYKDVFQFSPNRNKLLTLENTEYDLLTHFLKGDVSDGIPNVFSPENHFMIEGDKPRQKSITKKLIAGVREAIDTNNTTMLAEYFTAETMLRFEQNKELIDTTYTPKHLQDTIRALYGKKRALTSTKEHNIEGLLSPFDCEDEEISDNSSVRL